MFLVFSLSLSLSSIVFFFLVAGLKTEETSFDHHIYLQQEHFFLDLNNTSEWFLAKGWDRPTVLTSALPGVLSEPCGLFCLIFRRLATRWSCFPCLVLMEANTGRCYAKYLNRAMQTKIQRCCFVPDVSLSWICGNKDAVIL